jgi:hypothetical protein
VSRVYLYVVARDFGFAPNPFHGSCTLATCKPTIRRTASVGDWIMGMGGRKLDAVGRCIYAMRVTGSLSFDDYWHAPEFRAKQPSRNGTLKTIVGDNVYHRDRTSGMWQQTDSHHSQPDGTPDPYNVMHDTGTDRVLISNHFYYFGRVAPSVPKHILDDLGFKNAIGHRVYSDREANSLLTWLNDDFGACLNRVTGDPYQFDQGSARYSKKADKII